MAYAAESAKEAFRGAASWACHIPSGSPSECPIGTRVRVYRTLAESPVDSKARSYRTFRYPSAKVDAAYAPGMRHCVRGGSARCVPMVLSTSMLRLLFHACQAGLMCVGGGGFHISRRYVLRGCPYGLLPAGAWQGWDGHCFPCRRQANAPGDAFNVSGMLFYALLTFCVPAVANLPHACP